MCMKNKDLLLKIYAITLTFILVFVFLISFRDKIPNNRFEEITAERINIVDADGKLMMVLSNSERQHPGMMDGKVFPTRERSAGLIFFNKEEDEVGGLIFDGSKNEGAGMVLSFDQYKNDQIMQMQYMRTAEGKQKYGLSLWDRSETITLPRLVFVMDSLKQAGVEDQQKIIDIITKMNSGIPLGAGRLFTGKNFDGQTGVFIKDEYGRDRIKLFIGNDNIPHFQLVDEKGKIVKDFNDH